MAIEKVKRILDSVHGYVLIPDDYIREIIDTPEFQRLRRIEQTSCRALFPSARHDRFIHSIGVFHLGTLIADHLWTQACAMHENNEEGAFPLDDRTKSIIVTYRLACLLHDVGHTPFSHTFEDYFDNDTNKLLDTLSNKIAEDVNFKKDFETPMPDGKKKKLSPHEFISAIIAIDRYGTFIEKEHKWKDEHPVVGNKALLARMIVGCEYQDPNMSLENSFIELIHGYVIDADGLDYACRDVWASGYSTSKVDITRLIEAIRIFNDNGKYSVCYDAKAINEILSVLQVKSFQGEYVFSHHSVIFEQYLLVEAMKSVAMQLEVPEEERCKVGRKNALRCLCNMDMFSKDGHKTKFGPLVRYVMDDDFVSLMKLFPNDIFVKHWFGRKYDYFPLWKTREALLSDLPQEIRQNPIREEFWLYIKGKDYLKEKYGVNESEVMILDVDYGNRLSRINSIQLYVNHRIHPFNDICKFSEFGKEKIKEKADEEKKYSAPTFKLVYLHNRFRERAAIIKQDLVEQCVKAYNDQH